MPELLGAQLQGRPGDPRVRQPDMPEGAAADMLRCLDPRPERRFESASQFLDAWRRHE
jgi:hypothetical protein